MSVALDFDQLSGDYTEKITRWLPYYQPMLEGVIKALPESFSPRRILDLGCGNGNLTFLLRQAFPLASITLLDASEEMLARCRDRFEGEPVESFVQSYFQDATFPVGSFDLITAAFAIHHLESADKKDLFLKAFSWLNPGGFMSMTDLYVNKQDEPYHSRIIFKWQVEAEVLGTTAEEWDWIMEHYDAYDRPDNFEDQVHWLKEAGFDPVDIAWRKDAWGCVLARKND